VLGNKIGILLVVTIFSFTLITESFAETIFVDFDKSEYKTGENLTLSGFIPEYSMPIMAVSIYDPNGKILSANNLELDVEGNFSKTISLDSPFYDEPGIYKVKINYMKIIQEEFFTITGEASQPDSILKETITPEIILLIAEKEVYTDGDTVKITGIVSLKESTTVLIGIYDPFGIPAGFYFADVDKNLEFSKSFLVKAGVNFKVDGVYSIKAHYAESEAITTFEFYENIPNTADDNSNTADDNSNTADDNSNTADDNSNTADDNSKSADDNSKSADDNSKSADDNSKSADDNSKSADDNSKPAEQNSKKITTKQKDISIIQNNDKEQTSNTKPNNLSVEDIELGKLLNQIILECDRSKYLDTISYYDGMGPALYRLCKFDSSLEFFSESLSKDPNNVEVLTNKGSALRKLGYYDAALFHFDKAIEINSNFLPAINNKANTLANLGNYEEAVSLYAEVLGKNPGYIATRQNLELALSEMPQTHNVNFQKPIITLKENNSVFEDTLDNNEPIKLQKEKSPNFFEQISSMLSSLGSIFGISN